MFGSYNYPNLIAGSRHENNLVLNLKSMLGKRVRVVKNLQIYSPRLNKITDIDVLAITPNKIYCIECKSSRVIYGDFSAEFWKCMPHSHKSSFYIFNAYLQNSLHIRALRRAWYKSYKEFIDIENIVCVPNTCEYNGDCTCVYSLQELWFKILDDLSIYPKIYDVESIYKKVLMLEEISDG